MAATKHRMDVPDAQIAVRAYQRWIARGRPISDGADDWFAARTELEAELTTTAGHVVRRKAAARPRSARAAAAPR